MSAMAKTSSATVTPSKKANTSVIGRTPLGQWTRLDGPRPPYIMSGETPRCRPGAAPALRGPFASMAAPAVIQKDQRPDWLTIVVTVTMRLAVAWATIGATKLPRRRYK